VVENASSLALVLDVVFVDGLTSENRHSLLHCILVINHLIFDPTINEHLAPDLRLHLRPYSLLAHQDANILSSSSLLNTVVSRRPLYLPLPQLPCDEMFTLRHNSPILRLSLLPRHLPSQPPSRKSALAPDPDLFDPLDRLQRGRDQVPIVFDGHVAPFGELAQQQVLVNDHLFTAQGAMGFCPLELARLALHLEVFVAFGAAEAEGAGVVADEGDPFGWIDWARTEVACFDSIVGEGGGI
jgi:hypothetical protein